MPKHKVFWGADTPRPYVLIGYWPKQASIM